VSTLAVFARLAGSSLPGCMSERSSRAWRSRLKTNDSEDDTPYKPFDGHTLTISPYGTLSMADENDRALSVAAAGYAGFEFKRLEGVNPGDRLQVPLERKQLPFPWGRLRGSSLAHK
jgi:hypothetical protein